MAEEQSKTPELPEIDFTVFIMSLSHSAMMAMGVVADEKGESITSLPLAKQTIDILEMLQTKTQGNLALEEEKLLQTILHELRMTYVGKAQTRPDDPV